MATPLAYAMYLAHLAHAIGKAAPTQFIANTFWSPRQPEARHSWRTRAFCDGSARKLSKMGLSEANQLMVELQTFVDEAERLIRP
jgi:hypothetical protein